MGSVHPNCGVYCTVLKDYIVDGKSLHHKWIYLVSNLLNNSFVHLSIFQVMVYCRQAGTPGSSNTGRGSESHSETQVSRRVPNAYFQILSSPFQSLSSYHSTLTLYWPRSGEAPDIQNRSSWHSYTPLTHARIFLQSKHRPKFPYWWSVSFTSSNQLLARISYFLYTSL